jgi:hypothetical protein
LTGIQDANRTGYSAFQAKGGKILMAHGMHDALVGHRATQQLMRRLNETMGAANVVDLLRYYEIPGYGHAVSTVFNAAWDSLTALEQWVEQGVAPAAKSLRIAWVFPAAPGLCASTRPGRATTEAATSTRQAASLALLTSQPESGIRSPEDPAGAAALRVIRHWASGRRTSRRGGRHRLRGQQSMEEPCRLSSPSRRSTARILSTLRANRFCVDGPIRRAYVAMT